MRSKAIHFVAEGTRAYVHSNLFLDHTLLRRTPVRTPAEIRLVLPSRTDIARNRRQVRDRRTMFVCHGQNLRAQADMQPGAGDMIDSCSNLNEAK
jgi:hypothetical protein